MHAADPDSNVHALLQALMTAVEAEIIARLGKPHEAAKFSRQHLANSLWAMATLDSKPSRSLLAAVAQALQERVKECNPQEISNTVWAFAKLGTSLPYLHQYCQHMVNAVDSAVSTVWAFSELNM